MANTVEVTGEIRFYLKESQLPHLADCLDDVPEDKKEALFNMINHCERQRMYKKLIAMQVSEDVAAMLEGREGIFSKPFLTT